jgi:hypothetical protein
MGYHVPLPSDRAPEQIIDLARRAEERAPRLGVVVWVGGRNVFAESQERFARKAKVPV